MDWFYQTELLKLKLLFYGFKEHSGFTEIDLKKL